jgi:hypothetical protein
MGGVVHFPRSTRGGDSAWQEPADDVQRVTRSTTELSLITWRDARSHDGDDDGDGGGRAA